jgi:hypothetical protein
MVEPQLIDDVSTIEANGSTTPDFFGDNFVYLVTSVSLRTRSDGAFRSLGRFRSMFSAPDGVVRVWDINDQSHRPVQRASEWILVPKTGPLEIRMTDQSGSENEVKINIVAHKIMT